MQYHNLKTARAITSKRVGRGIGSGKGKTAGRGTKGQNARTGGGVRPGFEGGQNPLTARLPKLPGFKSLQPKATNIYTSQLGIVKGTVVDNFTLQTAGLIESPYVRIKVLFDKPVEKAYKVNLQGASAAAMAAIQKSGGTFSKAGQIQRSKKESSEK